MRTCVKLLPLFAAFHFALALYGLALAQVHQFHNTSILIKISSGSAEASKPDERLQRVSPVLLKVEALLSGTTVRRMVPLVPQEQLQNLHHTEEMAGWYILELNEAIDEGIMAKLEALKEIDKAIPDVSRKLTFLPDDPLLNNQTYLNQTKVPRAWDRVTGDSSIIIAILDNGVDISHPDLEQNIWVNREEANGLPGKDDDGNGYIDDLYGFDFADMDAEPVPAQKAGSASYHGTHIAGIAAAVGNNGVGISGVAWRCRILPVKVFSDADPTTTYSRYYIPAILYSIHEGARVLNLSWGGYAYSEAEKDAIKLAWDNGVAIVAAAGNGSTSELFYPADHHHVLSVAAVDHEDHLASFSNANAAVDLSAPGVDLFSTIPGEEYGRISGTSVATPLVSGTIALVKSVHPIWPIESIIKRTVLSADPYPPDIPEAEKLKMGVGRLNAALAVSDDQIPEDIPRIFIKNITLDDTQYGNGNGIVEKDESIELSVVLANYSLSGGELITLRCSSVNEAQVQWHMKEVSTVTYRDSTFALQNKFRFTVKSDSTGFVSIAVSVLYAGTEIARKSFVVPFGLNPILLVDDDKDLNDLEAYYQEILRSLSIPYSYWNHTTLGAPPKTLLSEFPIVVWFCESALLPDDQRAIQYFLSTGGKLFLCGQNIASNLVSMGCETFLNNVLKAEFIMGDSRGAYVEGVPGDPVGGGWSGNILHPIHPSQVQSPDVIGPLNGAVTPLRYGTSQLPAGIRYRDNAGLVFLGFGLEAVSTDPEVRSLMDSSRTDLFLRILNYLHPMMVTRLPTQFIGSSWLLGKGTYETMDQNGDSLEVYYRFGSQGGYKEGDVNRSGNRFEFRIPVSKPEEKLYYYFRIKTDFFAWYYPIAGPDKPLIVDFSAQDTIPPAISIVSNGDYFPLKKDFPVEVDVSDNRQVDTSNVYLYYGLSDSVRLVFEPNTGHFTGTISGQYGYGDSLKWWVKARDMATPPNWAMSEPQPVIIGYEGFEQGLRNWAFSQNVWWLDSLNVYGGHIALSTTPGGNYANHLNASIITREKLDLSTARQAELQFYTRFAIESGDSGVVEVSVDDSLWQLVAGPFAGYQTNWQLQRVSLNAFIGKQLRLRFRFRSDSKQGVPLNGWSVDELRLVQDEHITGVENTSESRPLTYFLSQGFPNPFSDKITFYIRTEADVALEIDIFNLLGQKVAQIASGTHRTKNFVLVWDGKDREGNQLPSGVYFLVAKIRGHQLVRKILYFR